MIDPGVFPVEPWMLREPVLHPELLGQTESLFALSNGHIGLRGNLDEGEPHHSPGTYLNGFFETVPMPYAERGYGFPEEGQSMIDVTNGKLIRLLVDDEPFDVRYGTLMHHERVLDMRAGVLRREVEWYSPAGQGVRIRSTRLVSFVQRAIVAIELEVEPIGDPARIVIQSNLVANEPVPGQEHDPRSSKALVAPLVSDFHVHGGLDAALGHHTKASGLRMAAAMDHEFEGPKGTVHEATSSADLARVTFNAELQPGEQLRVVKYLAYGWSAARSMPALHDQAVAALSAAKSAGWDGIVAEQREFLDNVWDRTDVEIEGDDELQQAVRYAIFQVVQAAARAEQRAIPAKGLTGRGYDGHSFWDMESYILPMVTMLAPPSARDALLWRHSTLDIARARAKELRLNGAAFPWRTIRGEECSGYWPAGTAGFHISGDIADAVRRYVASSEDVAFEEEIGLELLIETARLWASLGHHDATGGEFRIDGVTGPDEYTAVVDNNTFTNLMAARNFRSAADAADRYPGRAAELGVDEEEIAAWRFAADHVVIPYDDELGITQQSEGFTRYRDWDFEGTASNEYPLMLNYPYYKLYSSKVVKQADLVMALYLFGDQFDADQKLRDFCYYEAITVRDSSLSAAIQAVVAAEVGFTDLAYEYMRESALVDLQDISGNVDEGLHLAAMAGAWHAAVGGFGGLRDYGDTLLFSPRLPPALSRICFRLTYRGRWLKVTITEGEVEYAMIDGATEPIEILHDGERITVSHDEVITRPLPEVPERGLMEGPPGREPSCKGVGREGWEVS